MPPAPPLELASWMEWPRWRKVAAALVLGAFVGLGALTGLLLAYMQDLPVLPGPDNLSPSLATKIYDINGQLITQLSTENRTLIRLDQTPKNLVNALIALEDRRFWSHWGIDPEGILRAALVDLKTGHLTEGASTLTQQLAKNLFLTRERSFSRKIKEMLFAFQIERHFTKQEILEMYLNQVYFGNGAYGVEAAARTYFGKHASDLTLGECAVLAGIPRSPNTNNPINDPKQAQFRRDTALKAMLDEGMINQQDYAAALAEPITLFRADPAVAAYFVDYVRQQLEATYGANAVYKGGLSVYTTLDLRLQDYAQGAAERGARAAELKAAPFLRNEFGLAQKPVLQTSFLAMDPRNGHILAMVGGRDFQSSQFNRAVQARRQAGSAFKPFIYTAAIENGFTAADTIDDLPVVYTDDEGKVWKPENFDNKFAGRVTLRRALYESRNVVAVKLLDKIGIFNAVNTAYKMGITSKLTRNLSLALGTSEVSLLEMVNGFCPLANQGVRVEPMAILSVRDSNGKVLEENAPKAEEVLKPAVAYVVTNMLQDVIDRGTASNLRTDKIFTRIAAGKTGTTSDFSDAWFIGYTPDLVAGCWFGYDERRRIGRLLTGGAIAAPVWADFMNHALQNTPDAPFPVPTGVKFSTICADSGQPPDANCKRTIDEAFVDDGTDIQPVEEGTQVPNIGDFYENDLKGLSKGAAPLTASARAGTATSISPPTRAGNGAGGYNSDGSMGF
ncbi:MAG TPA: PBP1A family penicillin-binding protein [bacterium]|nr:PBP1A family penicillin-binding protein [bacterium]